MIYKNIKACIFFVFRSDFSSDYQLGFSFLELLIRLMLLLKLKIGNLFRNLLRKNLFGFYKYI